MEIIRRIYIKSEADLPKKEGYYIACNNKGRIDSFLFDLTEHYSDWFWYLVIVETTDADIEAYFKTWENPRIKTADEQYEKWLNKYLDELIDSAIKGAKAIINGEIKHIE